MNRTHRIAPKLSQNWNEVATRIRANCRIVVFLDFDGTLVDIAPRPDQVHLRADTRKVLRRLCNRSRAELVVISGRRRRELLQHIDVPGIRYFGIYGFERTNHSSLPRAASAALRAISKELTGLDSLFPGLWVEDKHFSLSVHLLAVPKTRQQGARRAVRSIARPVRRTLRIIENIRDMEIVPRLIRDKGAAVREFLRKPQNRQALPLYLGDDLSDESGFAAIPTGVSIRVGSSRPTKAAYSVCDPNEVAVVLRKLDDILAETTPSSKSRSLAQKRVPREFMPESFSRNGT
jgi:trehalose 6-phosphate phosphatase